MKKNIFVIIIVLLLFLLNGCYSSKLTIKRIDNNAPLNSGKTLEYNDFWDAMKNLNMCYAKNHEIDKEHLYFAKTLELIINGNLTDAENILQNLFTSSKDRLIRENSKKILENLLFSQSKWKKLLEFYSSIEHIEKNDKTKTLAEAFIKFSDENYFFPAERTIIPIKLSKSGCPILEVWINGYKQYFWIDTGAGLTVVSSDIAKKCKVYPASVNKIKAGTATSKQILVNPAVIKDLKIGKLSIKNHPAVIIDKKDLEYKLFGLFTIIKIDGIIGWNAIKNMNIEIDYRNKIVTIKKPIKMITTNRNLFWLGYPIVKVMSRKGIKLNFGLDTGARKTSITDNIIQKIRINDVRIKKKIIGSAGGIEKIKSKIIPELNLILNNYALQFKNIGTNHKNTGVFMRLDGIFGSDIAKNGCITINYLNGRFELKLPEEKAK